jgi:hypothetical protein
MSSHILHSSTADHFLQYEHTWRFVMRDGRQILLQAPNEAELNEWISRLNYASAFRSAGIRMRPLPMSPKDVELTGVAAATSHLHDIQQQELPAGRACTWDGDVPNELINMLSPPVPGTPDARRLAVVADQVVVDLEVLPGPWSEKEGFKATFNQVKAELAAGHWSEDPEPVRGDDNSEPTILSPVQASGQGPGSYSLPRSEIMQTKVRDLDTKILLTQGQLDADLRFVRNISTLTPFQKSTRDRLEHAVRNAAKKISQVRLEMVKLTCHRDVLSNDMMAAQKDWDQAKQMALNSAMQTLQSRGDSTIPQMTLSVYDMSRASPPSLALRISESRSPESSGDSFHSALDFGADWSSLQGDLASFKFLGASLFESTTHSSSGSSISFPASEGDVAADASAKRSSLFAPRERTQRSSESISSSRNSEDRGPHEKFYTALEESEEQAEDWNKTRAAQRVSLVRLPSAFRMSTLLETYSRQDRR